MDHASREVGPGQVVDSLTEWARGEPVALGAVMSALLSAIGIYVAPGMVAQLIAALIPIIIAVKTRRHTTPAANPAIPHVLIDPATDGPIPDVQRVRSFSRTARLSDLPPPELRPRRA
jgi:hypothetical protein